MITLRKTLIEKVLSAPESKRILFLEGVHRSGKSFCLSSIVRELRSSTPPVHAIHIGKGHDLRKGEELLDASRGLGVGPSALCVDDAHRIEGLMEALETLLSGHECRIILTGSRPTALAETLERRFAEKLQRVPVMPLSYGEWLEALQRRDSSEDFTRYLRQGGLPDSWLFPEDPERSMGDLTAMRVDSFLLREIVEGGSFRHPAALRPLLTLLANHMGEILSARQIRDALGEKALSAQSVLEYQEAARLSGLIIPAGVEDLTAGRELQSAQVWYFADGGLLSAFAAGGGIAERDRLVRNCLFLALRGAGWTVKQGRIDTGRDRREEITFVCEKEGSRIYVQTVGNGASSAERARKHQALLSVRDAWPKYLMDPSGPEDGREVSADGVRLIIPRDFLREGPKA